MVFGHSERGVEKRVSVEFDAAGIEAVVTALLEEWGYALAPPAAATLRLVGSGGTGGGGTILCRGPGGDGRLAFPLDVEELWIALGTCFYSPLRRHIRLPLHYPIVVCARGRRGDGHLTSLSAMGGRFGYDQELAPGEEVSLNLQVGDERMELAGRIIYVIDRRELETGAVEMGALFDRTRESVRQKLRELILAAYLERVRRRLDPEFFRSGLTGFRLPSEALHKAFLA